MRLAVSITLPFIASLLWASAPLRAGELPRVLEAGPGQFPAFVRLDTVLTPEGEVDSSLFFSSDADALRFYRRLPEENGCVRLTGLIKDYVNLGPLSSLKEASQKAKLVIVGTVKAQAQGFSGSEAGSLLEIEPQEVLIGSIPQGTSPLYAFFPAGNFSWQGKSYCATNPDWPPLPAVGDRLLAFSRYRELLPDNRLPLLDGTDVVVLREAGPEYPPKYKAERANKNLRSGDVLDQVRAYLRERQP